MGATWRFLSQELSPAVGGPKKNKEKALKDITNMLEVKPIKLKQTGAGVRIGNGSHGKDAKGIKRINTAWAEEDVIEPITTQPTVLQARSMEMQWASGFGGSRPPDPFRQELAKIPNVCPFVAASHNGVERNEEREKGTKAASSLCEDAEMQEMAEGFQREGFEAHPATSL